jgi:PAS domain S-box-containing protein
LGRVDDWLVKAPPAASLLITAHTPERVAALKEALRGLGQEILATHHPAEAHEVARGQRLAAAVVGFDGDTEGAIATAMSVRRTSSDSILPVIFISDQAPTPAELQRLYGLGESDFMLAPAPPEALRAKVALFAEMHRHREYQKRRLSISPREQPTFAPTENNLRLLTEAVCDYALILMDPDGVIVNWSGGAEHVFGFTAEEAIGRKPAFIFTPEDRAANAPELELRDAAAHGQALDERLHLRRDGSRFPGTGRVVALREGGTGELRGFAKLVTDASHLRSLEENERKFREIFETANEGIWILDASSRVYMVNQRMAELIGYSIRELIGREKAEFVFPEDREHISKLFEQRRLGHVASSVEVRFRHKSGRAVYTLLSARPMFRDGVFVGALDLFTDVSSRRQAEDRFRVFFESSAAGHALIDPETKQFREVNRRMAEIVGRTPEELVGTPYTDITHPDDREQDENARRQLLEGGAREVSVDNRYLRPDGSVVWVRLTTTMVRDTSGAPSVQVTVVQDISERKRAEAELDESRTRLRLALDAADLGVFYYNGATGEDSWTEQAKRLLGVAPEAPMSLGEFLSHIHPEDAPRITSYLDNLFTTGTGAVEFQMEFRVVWPDGTLHHLAIHGVRQPRETSAGGPSMLGTVRDITAAKQFELELKQKVEARTRELQEKTNQLESFCYTVAHDLRAPLRSINGYADIILDELELLDRDRARSYLERIKAATRRLDELIRDLLAYSRITQVGVTLEQINLGNSVRTAIHEVESEIQRTGASVSAPDLLPVVWGERSLVDQVVINLLSNALKFAPPGRAPRVEIFAEDHDGMVRLCVRDEGIGVSPEYHQRIFKVFERLQATRDYPGTGIGLAIVAKAAERMNGSCGVESQPGGGSTFWIQLHKAPPS